MLHDRDIRASIHQAVDLVRPLAAHFQCQLPKPRTSLQEKGSSPAFAADGDAAREVSSDSPPQSFFVGSDRRLAIAAFTSASRTPLITSIHSAALAACTLLIRANWSMSSGAISPKLAPRTISRLSLPFRG